MTPSDLNDSQQLFKKTVRRTKCSIVLLHHLLSCIRLLTIGCTIYHSLLLIAIIQAEYIKQGYGAGHAVELRDKNLLFLVFPSNQLLSFYDIKDVLDQYDCTGTYNSHRKAGEKSIQT